jgi:hypothetical protein
MRYLAFAGLTAGLLLAATLPAQKKLSTLFTSDNGRSTPDPGAFFDVDVLAPAGILVTGLDFNHNGTATFVRCDVYITPTTYVGKDTTPSAWTLVSSGHTATIQPRNTASFINVSDFALPKGKYGMYVHHKVSGLAYTNGTATNNFYSNTDLTLSLGILRSTLFGGTLFTPRIWNGSIYYVGIGEAFAEPYGAGCQGTNGVPTFAPATSSLPKINTVFSLDITKLPTAPGIVPILFGAGNAKWLTLDLPFSLTPLGLTGCGLEVDLLGVLVAVPSVNGSAKLNLPLPNASSLIGARFYMQALVPDSAANKGGLTVSNGVESSIGQ